MKLCTFMLLEGGAARSFCSRNVSCSAVHRLSIDTGSRRNKANPHCRDILVLTLRTPENLWAHRRKTAETPRPVRRFGGRDWQLSLVDFFRVEMLTGLGGHRDCLRFFIVLHCSDDRQSLACLYGQPRCFLETNRLASQCKGE
jgi:hypothetical protein